VISIATVLAATIAGFPQSRTIPTFADAFVRSELELTRYQAASVDLNDDGSPEMIVLANDREYCGSGGCTLFVLTPAADSYRIVTRMTVTRPPVRVLSTSSRGWQDLAVRVAGGGSLQPYDVALRFDGRSYPTNPSVVARSREQIGGKVVIE
jgi:hypothetical protein